MRLEVRENASILRLVFSIFIAVGFAMAVCSVLIIWGGASPMEALMAATSISAETIGLGDLIGTIDPGKEADLVVVGSDPLKNITALREPKLIMKGGRVVPPAMQVEARGELARLASGLSSAFS